MECVSESERQGLSIPTTRPPHPVSGAEWMGGCLNISEGNAPTVLVTRPSHSVNGAERTEGAAKGEKANHREAERRSHRCEDAKKRDLAKSMTRPPHAVSGAEWTGSAPTRPSHAVNGAGCKERCLKRKAAKCPKKGGGEEQKEEKKEAGHGSGRVRPFWRPRNEVEADNPGPGEQHLLKVASANVTSLRKKWPIMAKWPFDVVAVQEAKLGEEAQRSMGAQIYEDGWVPVWGAPRPLLNKVRAGNEMGINVNDAKHGGVAVLARADEAIQQIRPPQQSSNISLRKVS